MDERYESMDYEDVVSFADRLIAMLRKYEWCANQYDNGGCPECGNLNSKGHRSDCKLKEIISEDD